MSLWPLLIYGCRKNVDQTTGPDNPAVSQAKDWYERTFPAAGTRTTLAVNPANGQTDYSQLTQPNWEAAGSYTRWGDEVVEAPIDAASGLGITMQSATGSVKYKKEYSRSSFVFIKEGDAYKTYIMTIMADSAYVNGDPSKLALNHYNHRDINFSGMVLYYTPKGEFKGAFEYYMGRLIARSPVPRGAASTSSARYAQSLKKTNGLYLLCTYYYTVTYLHGVKQSSRLTEIICKIISQADVQGGDLPEEENNGGNNQPCPGQTDTEDGGYQPPADNPHNPGQQGGGCPSGGGVQEVHEEVVNVKEIKNNVKDSCLKKMVDAAIKRNIQYNLKQSMNSIFSRNTDFNLDFVDTVLYNSNGTINTTTDGETQKIFTDGTPIFMPDGITIQRWTNIKGMDVRISLNIAALRNASEEYITATILHEVLHAYFRAENISLGDHDLMVDWYIPWYKEALHAIYPTMVVGDLTGLAYGGLMTTGAFNNSPERSMLSLYQIVNDSFEQSRSGTPCH